jgi:pimeloyl-ACP methyl ester carboxylesterase
LPHAKYLHEHDFTTLLIDLRSFGDSDGKQISFGAREWRDVDAAYDFLAKQTNTPIGVFGNSMGAASAVVMAGVTKKPAFVIASVPYADLMHLFRFQIRSEGKPLLFLPFILLASFLEFGLQYPNYSPSRQIENISVPMLLIGAKHDKKVDPKDTVLLYVKKQGKKTLWEAETGHDVHKEAGEEFQKEVLAFLKDVS